MRIVVHVHGKEIHSYSSNAVIAAPRVGELVEIDDQGVTYLVTQVTHKFSEANQKRDYDLRVGVVPVDPQ